MAVVLIEGFDHLTAAETTAKGWNTAFNSMQTGRFSGQCGRITGNGEQVAKALPSSYSTLIYGAAFRFQNGGTNPAFMSLVAGSTLLAGLYLNTNGRIVVKNNGGTVIATGTTVLTAASWYFVEVKLVINGASGSVEVHLNGATEISSTTGNFGTTNIDTIQIGNIAGGGSYTDFDDLYAADTTGSAPQNTFLGDVRVYTVYPTGDGAHAQWTPDSGTTHYSRVDEAQADGDTSYVYDSTAGDMDTYTMGSVDTAATIFAIQTNLYARKDDANTRQIAPVIRQSTTDYVGTTVSLTSNYLFYTQIYNQDPTSTNWTPTTFNADQIGVKEVA